MIVTAKTHLMQERKMRLLLLTTTAALVAAYSATPALSQVDGFGHAIKEKKPTEYHQPARNDKAYQSALDRIPDSKDKYDPWGAVRQQPGNPTPPK
jgi:hypothetical protein